MTGQIPSDRFEWKKCPQRIDVLLENSDGNKIITLTLMTLQAYNENVRAQVAGQPTFQSDNEVQSYYLRQWS
jgi:hypothetical protein